MLTDWLLALYTSCKTFSKTTESPNVTSKVVIGPESRLRCRNSLWPK